MKMLFKAFGKKLFGERYERLIKNIFLTFIMYMGISSANYIIPVAPFIVYLMSALFTAGVMFSALNSKDSIEHFRNIVMMPFSNASLVLSYVSTLGIYTILTKTLIVWALVFSVNKFDIPVIICGIIAGICSVLMCSVFYANKSLRPVTIIWAGLIIGSIFGLRDMFGSGNAFVMMAIFGVSSVVSIIILANTDGYAFYDAGVSSLAAKGKVKSHKHNLVWTYLFRYLMSHKNYLVNTVIMWGVAVLIPFAFTSMLSDQGFTNVIMYMGFGIVALNTPLCILISCDPDLDRGIRCLPGGAKSFFVPYGLFLFVSICITYGIYLTSWQIKFGTVDAKLIILGVVLAAISATLSIALEFFFPVKNWKIESDLWHHPRKYVVPAIVLLLACAMGTLIG